MPLLIVSPTFDQVDSYLRMRAPGLSPTQYVFVTRARQLRSFPDAEVVVLDGWDGLPDREAIAEELRGRPFTSPGESR